MKKKVPKEGDMIKFEGKAYFVDGSVIKGICTASFILKREHPIDEFDRLTSNGYKLNLITGEYWQPSSP